MKGFMRTGMVLVGLLVLAVGIISLGHVDTKARPSIDSYGPSGTAALASLLRERGFDVRVDRTSRPKMKSDELAVAFVTGAFAMSSVPVPAPARTPEAEEDLAFADTITQFAKNGGHLLVAEIDSNFQQAASDANALPIVRNQEKATVTISKHGLLAYEGWSKDPHETWVEPSQTAFVKSYSIGRGVGIALADGIGMMNRYLDRNDNARFMVSLLEAAAPAKKIVFLEAGFGEAVDPGLMESLGGWAKYGWTQLLLLCLVVAFTLGKRFGMPDVDRVVQRGQRELVDAVGSLYYRSRADKTAIGAVLKNADRDLRRSLKLSFDAAVEKRNEQLPESLLRALQHAELVASVESPEIHVLAAARRVEREVSDFIGSRTVALRRRSKT
jgi:hypothetical protein